MKTFKFLVSLFCILLLSYNYSNAVTCKKIEKQLCNSNGNNCWISAIYEYDNLGNQIEYYSPFRNNFSQKLDNYSLRTFVIGPKYRTRTVTDKYGNKIVSYVCEASDFSDCKKYDYTKENKYIYDERGNILQETNNCGYGNPAVYKYTYDQNNNMLTSNKRFCYSSSDATIQKYEYDIRGNKIAEYTCSDETFLNCKKTKQYQYDKNNNLVKDNQYRYEYVTMANGNKYKKIFAKSGQTGEEYCLHQEEYDSRGNLLRSGINCPGDTKGYGPSWRKEYDQNNHYTAMYECKFNKNIHKYESVCNTLTERKKYDAYGNLIERYYNPNGKYVVEKYKYECK